MKNFTRFFQKINNKPLYFMFLIALIGFSNKSLAQAGCNITVANCPPVISPECADEIRGGIFGTQVTWTPPDFNIACPSGGTGFDFSTNFDLPESQNNCWRYNYVQRTGTGGGRLRLYQSTGVSGTNPSFTTPSFYMVASPINCSFTLTNGSGAPLVCRVYLVLANNTNAPTPLATINTSGTGAYPFTVNPATAGQPAGIYRLFFEFIGAGNNQDYIDLLQINAPLISTSCGADINFYSTSNHYPGDFFPVGTTPVNYTATCNSCIPVITLSCNFNVIVNGVTASATTTNASCGLNNGSMTITSASSNLTPVLEYNINNSGWVGFTSPLTLNNLAPGNYTVNVRDNFSNIPGYCQILSPLTVSIGQTTDTTAPTTPTLPNVTGQCSVTVTPPTTTDGCAGTITGTTTSPLTYNTQGTFVITWTFTDGNGNSTTATQNVIVDDTVAPITPTLPNVTGQCSATVTPPSTTDICAGTITGTTSSPLTYNTQGTFVITWTFNDGNGNSTTATQNVIVDDTVAPITPTLPNVIGQCSATVTPPSTTDSCAGTITGTTTDALTYNTQGTFVITWTFNDGNGNSTTATQNVIVDDTVAPTTPTLANVTGQCSATVTPPTTTDACSGTITGTTTDALTYNTQGTFVITWTFNDGNGNSTTATQNVIVDDTVAPTTPTLADVTGQCSATVTPPTTTDACVGTITGTTTDALTYNTQGTFVITWTFNDGNGNSTTATQNVIVDDTVAPITPTLPNVTGQCSATVTPPTTTDACSGTITGTTTDALTYNTQGTFVITWTFNDGNGNSTTATQNVIVDDTLAPTTPTLADVTGQCSATVTPPTTTDTCSGTITGTTTDALTYNTQGTFVITWTFNDGNGNSTTAIQNVIVDDTLAPTTPTLTDVTGQCSATVTPPTTTDACAGTITGTTTDALTYNTQGAFVITWAFNDGNGNSTTATQNVIVDDTLAPTTPTLADVTGQCSATVTPPTITDACVGTITGTTTDALTYNTQGTFVITWTFNDGNGNSTTATQNVIVDDTLAPTTPILADVTGQCSATATPPTTTDTCSGTITGTTTDALTYNTQGTFVITWTFNDGNGNSTTATQNVIVDDTVAPITPTLPNVTGQCSATVTPPTTTDACSGTITGTTTDALTYNTQGTFVITWAFNDGNGNSTNATQNVIVDDTIAPITPTLADVTGQCSATATPPTTTDACVGTITGTTTDALTYNTQGTFVITWTFNDGNGNSTNATQNVIVDDTIAPITPTLADVTGQCSATATPPTTTDACVGTITGTTTDALTYNTQGTFVITWTFNDGNGNSTTATQNVIIDNTAAPTAPILADVTGQCSVTVTPPTTTNACTGNVITGTTSDALTYNTQGTFIITWTFNDGNGNSTTATQNVIVDDTVAPTTPILADVTGQCSATATPPTTTDTCSGTITGTTTDALTYNTQGAFVITWTFNDGNGNSTTATQNVIVNDTVAPTAPTLADVTGQCSATVTPPTTTDACAGTITGTTTDALTYNTQGTFVITWTFNDGNGNSTTATQNVIVDDTVSPTTPTLADVTGQCSATVTPPTTTDACSGTITGTTTDALTYNTQGTFVITWTFNDGNGNSTTATQNVIVDDTLAPTAPTLADVTGQCSATVTPPTTTDACAGTITGTTTDALTYNTQGTFVITWTFNDGNGNSTTATQNVIVDNTIPPTAPTLADVTGQCSVTVTPPTTINACTGTVITGTTTDPLTYNTQGTFVITWTFNDGNGNSTTATQNIIVDDTVSPTWITTAGSLNTTVECNNANALAIAQAQFPIANDLCDSDVTNIVKITGPFVPSSGCANTGSYTNSWTVTDDSGNISVIFSQTIFVNDNVAPTFVQSAPVNTTASCDNIPAPAVLTAIDNCGTATVTLNENIIQGNCPSNYQIVRTWTTTDVCGNSSSVSQTITVIDNVAPVTPEAPANVTVTCAGEITAPTSLTAVDNCSGSITAQGVDTMTPGNCPNSFTITRTWTFTDTCGNSSSVSQTITVNDNVAPTFVQVAPANTTASCDNIPAPAVLTAIDNCGTATVTLNETIIEGNCPSNYQIVRTWTATDACGNTTSALQTIAVSDTVGPVLVTPLPPKVDATCDNIPEVPVLVFTDNCSGTVTTPEPTITVSGVVDSSYTITRTWVAVDACGNLSQTYTQFVFVDQTTEVITLPSVQASNTSNENISLDGQLPAGVTGGTWSNENNVGGFDPINGTFNPFEIEPGEYLFSYTISDGECPIRYDVLIIIGGVGPCEAIIIHNSFTPNGDSFNQYFSIEHIEDTNCYPSNNVQIYNRWGTLVYETKNYDNNTRRFEGISEGRATVSKSEELPTGTYFYIIEWTTSEGNRVNKNGYIYLTR